MPRHWAKADSVVRCVAGGMGVGTNSNRVSAPFWNMMGTWP